VIWYVAVIVMSEIHVIRLSKTNLVRYLSQIISYCVYNFITVLL